MKSTATQLGAAQIKRTFSWVDVIVLLGVFGLLWTILHFGRGMVIQFDENQSPAISTDIRSIPYYAGRTVLRMWLAFVFSLLFTFSVGYAAAKSRAARAVILPALDILQSVPVLGFLSITVTGFMALFPGSLLGVECASIFAIFTGQVWNMAFGFYHSLVTIPKDLQEAATNFRLSLWQRFGTLEVPSSMHSLIWNSMMSFGGGWFFVAQSEAITVLNKNIKLPGLGSFMATAVENGDNTAAVWAIVAMLVVIIASDQLIWRPLLAWADKFKIELVESGDAPKSWLYTFLRRVYIFEWIDEKISGPLSDASIRLKKALARLEIIPAHSRGAAGRWVSRLLFGMLALWVVYQMIVGVMAAAHAVYDHVSWHQFLRLCFLGLLTMGRVATMTILATLVWTPIGVWIASKPNVARFAQPFAQIAASFPVNMTFPFVVGFLVAAHISINWGSIVLIAMGTQWYILFNVIAGAMAIPNDLKEAATTYGLHGWSLWRTLILPAIFPFWVTGACTAAGGAWNASIVAELATWGHTTLKAEGLGAYIAEVTQKGDTPMIICSIAVMCIFVVITNKLLWRRLYEHAEKRFHLD
ncbi:MAG: ABC transporter permease subunit [Verrucomicrobia bacterium]|nr:ABC transporter permease subunit [Verrucomicrobiota bacterium]